MFNLFINKLNASHKRIIVFSFDTVVAFISFPVAVCIRYGSYDFSKIDIKSMPSIFLIIAISKIIGFFITKLYRGIWRYASMSDLLLIIKSTSISISFSLFATFLWVRLETIPRSIFIIDWFLTVFFLGGGRFIYRIIKDRSLKLEGDNSLLIGAGSAGDQLLRELTRSNDSMYNIVGILDDNPLKHGRTIQGVKILGRLDQLSHFIDQYGIKKIIIAMPSVNSSIVRKIVNNSIKLNVEISTLPSLSDIIGGKISVSQLRSVKIEDLLRRKAINLDLNSIGKMLSLKVILVTGAGGSIGSELCKQILNFSPTKIILLDNGEFNLYSADLQLKELFPLIEIVPIIADVKDENRLNSIFCTFKPEIVFHAAAYKHVPMMEINPYEAVKNNIGGTINVARASVESNVKKFILISTDKAVNPTNIMGATKRITEIICQDFQNRDNVYTQFITVRFGNVLGSAGSVVPRFMDQIKRGGPITVTHADITRYFMSIPEASQLVLQAGCLGKGGEIFVLEMGDPIKIYDLAKDLINLCGLKLDEDIKIKITGLRPAEKLYEEVLASEETTLPTQHDLVRVAKARENNENILKSIAMLLNEKVDDYQLKNNIRKIVPEYTPY